MEMSNNIDELKEQVYVTSKTIQEIVTLSNEANELTEQKNEISKKIKTLKSGIAEKIQALFAPYVEHDGQQKIKFSE